jgi:hypothetical protein
MRHEPAVALLLALGVLSGAQAAALTTRDLARLDRERILKRADAALSAKPVSITSARAPLGEGGPHDFYSNGDYWWPDPTKADGLPYLRRDGESNPNAFFAHRDAMRGLRDAVAALAAAFEITRDERYAAKAAELLRVFFLDAQTRMAPHFRYAQAIPGVSPGRGVGIIDGLHLIEIPKAAAALAGSPAFQPALTQGLRQWFGEMAAWMTTHPNGLEEARADNNHSVAYFLQLAVFAGFAGDAERVALSRRRFKEVLLPGQMAPDGSFPRELARTKPYGYSIFQLEIVVTLCHVLSGEAENLWSLELKDGRSVRRAMDFLYPYLADKSKWPYRRDVEHWDGWPVRQSSLLFAGLAYDESRYLDLWQRLEADPKDAEVRRNMPITQPILWIR